jgi:hypothetical protein
MLFCLAIPARAMAERPVPETCTYETATWNVKLKRSVDVHTVSHPYADLLPGERDPGSGCTVCREDQVPVNVPGVGQVMLCYKVAKRVEDVLLRLVARGAHIVSLRGYKVIRSRGPLDAGGNRTGFSNHSYGAALDINRELNGLYKNCVTWGPRCRLAMGGPWRPGVPGTLVKGGAVVSAMKDIGFKWGGEIAGRQKDFMHFSITGY